jgi:hypothetical protein
MSATTLFPKCAAVVACCLAVCMPAEAANDEREALDAGPEDGILPCSCCVMFHNRVNIARVDVSAASAVIGECHL